MYHLNRINKLSEYLKSVKLETGPILVNLNTTAVANYLVDSMITKVLNNSKHNVRYVKLDQEVSKHILQELQLRSYSSLLLIFQGEIKSILSGTITRFKIEQAISDLNQVA